MKLWIGIVLFFLFNHNMLTAQVRLGVKGGISSYDISPESIIISNEDDVEDFSLEVEDAKYGLHLGIFIQANAGSFFFQPELLVNSNSVEFRIKDIQGVDPDQIKDENYQFLDIPVLFGFSLGPVKLGGGPVGHLFLSSNTDLKDLNDDLITYEQDFKRFQYGWQAGLGVDLWKLHLDVRYEGNVDKFGNHMVFSGDQYTFDKSPTRLMASVGISF